MSNVYEGFYEYGEEDGRKEEKAEAAKNLLKFGIAIEVISASANLPIETIMKLNG